MPPSRRQTPAGNKVERMVSHNRYTPEQKRFFALNLKLWNEKLISKDEVVKRFREKFNDKKFGYSQYRYLRQEVGRDVVFGAPLLHTQRQMPPVLTPQPAAPVQYSPPQPPPQTVPTPQISYENTQTTPAADVSLFTQPDFLGGCSDFPDLTVLLEDQVDATPAADFTQTSSPITPVPAQQQPASEDGFECSGGEGCTIPMGAPHRHEPNGSIVFQSESAVVSMIAMERMLARMGGGIIASEQPQLEPSSVNCTSGPDYLGTAASSWQDHSTPVMDNPAIQSNVNSYNNNNNSNNNNMFASLNTQPPLLGDSSPNFGTTTGETDFGCSMTDMIFDDDMLSQLCSSTVQGATGPTDSIYLPATTVSQYPFLQVPGQISCMSPSTSASLAGHHNWTQAGTNTFTPSLQPVTSTSAPTWPHMSPPVVPSIAIAAPRVPGCFDMGTPREN